MEKELRREARGEFFPSQWLQFVDANGPGFAQPDFYFVRPDSVLCIECKLTQHPVAWEQLRGLYAPLLEKLYARPVVCVQVCKNLRQEIGRASCRERV